MDSARKDRSGLRVVVQYVHGDHKSPWHLVAYGGGRAFHPRRFQSVDDLLKVIHSALPDFEPAHLLIKRELNQSYIVWAGDIVLKDSQLSAMGLKTEPSPKS